jgi:hypothetical protein
LRIGPNDFTTRDEQEVAGYAQVMELVFSAWQDIALTENHVKQLHRDLLTYSEKDGWHRGNYKTSTNRGRQCKAGVQSHRVPAVQPASPPAFVRLCAAVAG